MSIEFGAFGRFPNTNPLLHRKSQEKCPCCSILLVEDGVRSQGYFLCDDCATVWHEDCAFEIFEQSLKRKDVSCLCPICGGIWRNTHFEQKKQKETINYLMSALEEEKERQTTLEVEIKTLRVAVEACSTNKEQLLELKKAMGRIIDQMNIDSKNE